MYGKRKNLAKNTHISRNVVNEAEMGMNEISNFVEHYSPQMTELAERRLSAVQNNLRDNLVNANGNMVPDLGRDVIQSNIVDQIIPVIVTRNSYNITGTKLPFVIFSPVNFPEEYKSVLGQLQNTPANITDISVAIFQKNTVRFTYTDNSTIPLVDTIDITTDFAVNYPTILKMLETDYFIAKGVKYTAESGNYDAQFNAFSLQAGRSTMFGLTSLKGYPVSSFKRADQQQNNIVNLDATLKMNGRRFLSLGMDGAPPTGQTTSTIKLDVFVTEFGSSVDKEPITC